MATKRMSVTVDDELLAEAVRVSGAGSGREAIELGLRELVRRNRIDRMIRRAGTVELTTTVDELLRERERESE